MARNDYRSGRKRAEVLLPVALHANVRRLAAGRGVSMADWMVEALREAVSRDAGGDCAGVGRVVGADRGGSRLVEGGGGSVVVGVGSGDGDVAVVMDAAGNRGFPQAMTGVQRLDAVVQARFAVRDDVALWPLSEDEPIVPGVPVAVDPIREPLSCVVEPDPLEGIA